MLVIECKHLHFHKTLGEIAEQLSDYRGRTGQKGRKDDLRKHLDRIEVIMARKSLLCKKIGIDEDVEIEGWIIFKYPVPMIYAWKEFEDRMKVATYDDISNILEPR